MQHIIITAGLPLAQRNYFAGIMTEAVAYSNIDIDYKDICRNILYGLIAIKTNHSIQFIDSKHNILAEIHYISWPQSVTTPQPTSISASMES